MSKYYYSMRENADIYSIYFSPKVILGLLLVLTIIIAISCWKQLYNLIVYANKKFTKSDLFNYALFFHSFALFATLIKNGVSSELG